MENHITTIKFKEVATFEPDPEPGQETEWAWMISCSACDFDSGFTPWLTRFSEIWGETVINAAIHEVNPDEDLHAVLGVGQRSQEEYAEIHRHESQIVDRCNAEFDRAYILLNAIETQEDGRDLADFVSHLKSFINS